MQVAIEETGSLGRRITIQIPEDSIEQKVQARLKEMGPQVKLKGFRPGHVPAKVVRQRYGRQIREEIVGQEIQQAMSKALEEESLRPIAAPSLEDDPDGLKQGDVKFSATFEVFPELPQIQVSDYEIEAPEVEITESDIDEMIETLRTQQRTWNTVDRAASTGDQITLDLVLESGSDRYPDEGEDRVSLVLGEGATFEALEEALEGMAAGDSKTVQLTLPENFREPRFAGQTAEATLHAREVKEANLPEVDESFARSFGIADGSIDTLREEVRGNLERELKQARLSVVKANIVSKLLEKHEDIDMPRGAIEAEAQRLASRSGSDNADLAAFEEGARRRVAAGMLLGEIARQQEIKLDGDRVREAIIQVAQTYEDPQAVLEMYTKEPQLMEGAQNAVIEEQVVEWVTENANMKPAPMSFREVIAAAAAQNR